jgi:hypothetical protein
MAFFPGIPGKNQNRQDTHDPYGRLYSSRFMTSSAFIQVVPLLRTAKVFKAAPPSGSTLSIRDLVRPPAAMLDCGRDDPVSSGGKTCFEGRRALAIRPRQCGQGGGRAISPLGLGSPGGESGIQRMSEIALLRKSFSILRILTGCRSLRLPKFDSRCGSEGTEPLPTEKKERSCVPTQVFASLAIVPPCSISGIFCPWRAGTHFLRRMTQSDGVIVHT